MIRMIIRLKCIKIINDSDVITRHKELVFDIKFI